MTFQVPERLEMAGTQMVRYTAPLDALMSRPGRRIPFCRWRSTGCKRGYIGEWELDSSGRLLLHGFDEQHSRVYSIEPLEIDIEGWMALTALPDGAPQALGFGSVRLPVPSVVTVTADAGWIRTWLRHSEAGLVLGLPHDELNRWQDSGSQLALETSKSYFALMGDREPHEFPIEWNDEHPALLTFDDFEPLLEPASIALERLGDLLVTHNPVGLTDPPWQSHHVSRVVEGGLRENIRYSIAYLPTGAVPDRIDLRECRWWRHDGDHVVTLDDVDPEAARPLHATWFTGELRLVPDTEVSRHQATAQSLTYDWDSLVFEDELVVTVRDGNVV